MRSFIVCLFCFLCIWAESPQIKVSFSSTIESKPLDGRLLLLISKKNTPEPRFLISDGPGTQQVFGKNVTMIGCQVNKNYVRWHLNWATLSPI